MGHRMDRSAEDAETPVQNKRRMSGLGRWLLWIGGIALVVLLIVGSVIAILLRRAEPILRASLIDTLQKRFHAKVELDDLHVSIVDGFRVEGSGLRIWLPPESEVDPTSAAASVTPARTKPNATGKRPAVAQLANGTNGASPTTNDSAAGNRTENSAQEEAWRKEPWIVVGKMHFHASWRILPGKPIVVSVIYVQGVRVLLPPKQDRPHLSTAESSGTEIASDDQSASQGSGNQSETSSSSSSSLFKMPHIEVRRIECQDALLEIERRSDPGKPPKVPLDYTFRKATIIPDGAGGPMAFDVEMTNAKPVGNIHSTGHAGPWVSGDPGSLPVDGDYKFDHADLGTIKGIAGILSSRGHYAGTLREIEVDGVTNTPDFRLERVSKNTGESLTTHFHAIVDGTTGDTQLQPVDAMLGHTHIVAKGKIMRAEDSTGQKHGHDIVLEATVDRGRIEDILHISANQVTPFMTGNLTLQTHFHLPAGQESVWDKLQLDGQFHLSQSRFSSDKMQGRIEELSLRGQGKPKELKTSDSNDTFSEMQGHFQLGGGTLQLPDLDYRVPGAEIAAHGSYGLKDGALNFEGDAKLDASISEIVGGWKGFLLKPADRLLRKNGAGTDVPIRVSGTRSDPKFGVEFNRLGKTDKADKEPGPDKP
jgi:hypothetical protein